MGRNGIGQRTADKLREALCCQGRRLGAHRYQLAPAPWERLVQLPQRSLHQRPVRQRAWLGVKESPGPHTAVGYGLLCFAVCTRETWDRKERALQTPSWVMKPSPLLALVITLLHNHRQETPGNMPNEIHGNRFVKCKNLLEIQQSGIAPSCLGGIRHV